MLGEVLRRVFGDRPVSASLLAGGLTNCNYLVDDGASRFVVRIAGADTELLGIDREREHDCCRAAAAVGLGPEVVAFLPEQRALVTRFQPGQVLTEEDARRPDVLRRVADALRRCHAVEVSVGRFSVFDTVRTYLEQARGRGVAFPDTLPAALAVFQRIEAAVRPHAPPCLCHNDLLASNLIDHESTIRLIDWEYAGVGDRYFDLGNLAANLRLGPEQEAALLEAYFGEVTERDLLRMRQMRLASDLREAAWGYLQAAISRLNTPEFYLDYGRTHIDRFLAGASS